MGRMPLVCKGLAERRINLTHPIVTVEMLIIVMSFQINRRTPRQRREERGEERREEKRSREPERAPGCTLYSSIATTTRSYVPAQVASSQCETRETKLWKLTCVRNVTIKVDYRRPTAIHEVAWTSFPSGSRTMGTRDNCPSGTVKTERS